MENKLKVIIKKFKSLSSDKRKKIIIIAIGILLAIWVVLCTIFGSLMTPITHKSALLTGITTPWCMITSLFFVVVLALLVILKLSRTYDIQNKPMEGQIGDGENSAILVKRGTGGTARMLTDDEVRKIYDVGGINTTITDEDGNTDYVMKEDVLGQLLTSEDGREAVTNKRPDDPKDIQQNNNIVLGASGRGKSFGVVRPLMIMAARRGSSIVVSDPATELYCSMSGWLKCLGYNVICFNINNVRYSDCWDCLAETISPQTERLDHQKLSNFVEVYFSNGSGGEKRDWWYNIESSLLITSAALCSWQHEDEMMKKYKEYFLKLDGDISIAEYFQGLTSFKWCKNQIRKVARKKGIPDEEVEKEFQEIEDLADEKHPYSIAQVIKIARSFADEDGKYEEMLKGNAIPEDHPCKMEYITYSTMKKPEVQAQVVSGLLNRLSIFYGRDVRLVCSNKGINLRNINKEKTAVFVCTSDKTSETALRPIVSLFFTFLFDDILDSYDAEQQLAEAEGRDNTCLPVSIILDELLTIGTLGTKDEKTQSYMLLPTVFAEARKRKMTNTLIVQDVTMLRMLYGENGQNTLLNNTRNIINLGVYDDKSSEFMSKLMGKTTVLSESHKFGGDTIGTKVSNVSETSRDLRTPDETRKLKKHHVYLVTAGQYPVELKTVPYTAIEPFCFKDDRKPKSVSLYDRRDLDERIANNELRKDPFSTGSIEPIIKEKEESGIEDIYSDGEKAEEKNENSSVFNFTGDVEETQNDAEDNSKSVDDNSGENLSEDLESEFEDIKTTLDTDLIDETEDTENSANKVVSDSNHSKDDEQTANGVESSEMAQNDGNSAKKGKPVRRQDARNRGRKNKHDSKLENL